MRILGAFIMFLAALMAYLCPAFHTERERMTTQGWVLVGVGFVLIMFLFGVGLWMVLA